jgi:outer membrane immunogenic protein
MRIALVRFTTLAFAALGTTAALAGDYQPPPPPPPPPGYDVYAPQPVPMPVPQIALRPATYNWSGSYAGGFVGAMCAKTDSISIQGKKGIRAETNDCIAHGGALIGYNVQVGDIVYGAEADYALGGTYRDSDGSVSYTADFDPITSLRGRVGYAGDKTLYYVTGGLGFIGGQANGEKAWHMGWLAGAGAERRLSERLSMRGEVLYGNFSKESYDGGCCRGSIDLNNVALVRVGLTWNFGDMIAPKAVYMPPPPPYVGVGG